MAISNAEFQLFPVLKERINRYFEESGKSRKADIALFVKIAIVSIIPVVGYLFLLLYGGRSIYAAAAGYLVYTIGCALFVVNVAHDASHQAFSTNRSVNRLLSFSWNIVGISKYLWEIKHHHSHHIYTNIPYEDVDIAESPLLRFSPAYPYKNYYKYQYLYAIPLYGLFGIFIVFVKDFVLLFTEHGKSQATKSLPPFFLARLIWTKLLYFTISFIIPYTILPYAWWQVMILFLFSLAIAGALLLLVLVVPHINEKATLPENSAFVKNRNEWVLHQIHCTVDSSPESKPLGWLSGGLNTHLIHHLFPNICHTHYVDLSRIVKQTLQEKGIEYHQKTFTTAIIDHFKYLKVLGRPAAIVIQQFASMYWLLDFIREGNL